MTKSGRKQPSAEVPKNCMNQKFSVKTSGYLVQGSCLIMHLKFTDFSLTLPNQMLTFPSLKIEGQKQNATASSSSGSRVTTWRSFLIVVLISGIFIDEHDNLITI